MVRHFQFFFVVIFSLALAPATAFSNEEPPAVKALLDATARQYKPAGGSRPTYGSISPDGQGGATLNNVTMATTNKDAKMSFNIEKVVVSGVNKRSNGQYSIALITSENITMTMDLPNIGPIELLVPVTSAKNTHILPAVATDGLDYTMFMSPAVSELSTVPLVTVSVGGKKFNAKNFVSKWAGDPNTGFGKWDISMESLVIPLETVPDAKAREEIKSELGLEKFDLSLQASASISGKNKKLDIAYAIRFTGKNIGSFEIAIGAGDIPVQLGEVLKEIQAGAKPNMGKIMPHVVGIKLAMLKLRFADDNFAAKALAFAAKKQGTTVEAMTANGAAIIQIGLAQIRAPEFTKSVVAAYQSFVADPSSISVEASPQSPVALATLMGMMAAPAAAIQTLGVKVLANQ